MRFASWSDGPRRLGELRLAAQFFTRMPLGVAAALEPDALARAAWAFPLVGGAVGMLCGLVALLADAVGMPPLAAAVMAGVAAFANRQIGGHTGDVLGVVEQGGETVVLLAAAAWAW